MGGDRNGKKLAPRRSNTIIAGESVPVFFHLLFLFWKCLCKPRSDQFFHQGFGQRFVDRELKGATTYLIPGDMFAERTQHRTAHRKIGAMVLVGSETCYPFSVNPECWDTIVDALLRAWNDVQNSPSEGIQCAFLGLLNLSEIIIDIFF